MNILGVNAYHGDAAAALLCAGELASAVEEERFRRVKHYAGFPTQSICSCLAMAGLPFGDIDRFAVSRDPSAHRWRKMLSVLRGEFRAGHVVDRLRNHHRIGDVSKQLAETLGLERKYVASRLHYVEHHPAHLASAYYVSPFEEAAVCAVDGFGDYVSTSWAIGRGERLDTVRRVFFPHSLGLVYLALTQYLGFPKYGDEYKVMGLAPYGQPRYEAELRQLIHLLPDGGFEIDLTYFRHHREGVSMEWEDGEPTIGPVFTPKLEALLGPARMPDAPLEAHHEAIAASLQKVHEDAVVHVLSALYERTRIPRLCLAGGCAMNSVVNGRIRERTPFKEVFIQPAAGDNGTALGAALYVAHQVLGQPRRFVMEHPYWGPGFEGPEIAKAVAGHSESLKRLGCRVTLLEADDELCRWTAERIAAGKIVGWFQGRMECGARALGNRSILADPRRPNMREIINTKIKFRERFRPFAPSVLEENLEEYFEGAVPDPFMIQVYPVRPDKRQVIPAVTHVDGTGRLQTVSRKTNPLFWDLIRAFEKQTGVSVLLNTSFNENEPIVHRPEEALACFLRTGMDFLVMGNWVLEKSSGPALLAQET